MSVLILVCDASIPFNQMVTIFPRRNDSSVLSVGERNIQLKNYAALSTHIDTLSSGETTLVGLGAHIVVGHICHHLGLTSQAHAAYVCAVQSNPMSAEAWSALGVLYTSLGTLYLVFVAINLY